MSHIDWPTLLAEHRIEYVTSGPNVRRGEINIQCPFCGSSDPSHHMGIDTDRNYWSCWRNRAEHSGKSPVRLLMRLLHIGHTQALMIAGLDPSYVDPDGFQALAQSLRNPVSTTQDFKPPGPLELDPEFYDLNDARAVTRHWDYLENRYFEPEKLRAYGVCCGVLGDWANRVIFPYYEHTELVTWTGRALGNAMVRYKDLALKPKFEGDPYARIAAKDTLYNHDAMLAGGIWLIIVEGPIDALKLDIYGSPFGVRSVALSTASISERQLSCLSAFGANFKYIGIMMDNGNPLDVVNSLRMQAQLAALRLDTRVLVVPNGRKDAGEMSPSEIRGFARRQSQWGTTRDPIINRRASDV